MFANFCFACYSSIEVIVSSSTIGLPYLRICERLFKLYQNFFFIETPEGNPRMTSASQTTPGLALNGPFQDKVDQVPKQLPMNDSMDEVRIIYYTVDHPVLQNHLSII